MYYLYLALNNGSKGQEQNGPEIHFEVQHLVSSQMNKINTCATSLYTCSYCANGIIKCWRYQDVARISTGA